MNLANTLAAVVIAIGFGGAALAQSPGAPERPAERARPMKPEQRCDRLAGAEKEKCLREARRMPDGAAQGGPTGRGSCDRLVGQEKELCLKRGGTVEAGARSVDPKK